jgi:hypothetical protein
MKLASDVPTSQDELVRLTNLKLRHHARNVTANSWHRYVIKILADDSQHWQLNHTGTVAVTKRSAYHGMPVINTPGILLCNITNTLLFYESIRRVLLLETERRTK